MTFVRATPVLLAAIVAGCADEDAASVDCATEAGETQIEARAGALQSDGSVTVYGAVQFPVDGGAGELTVRDVYVAGEQVSLGSGDFNFRTWSVSIASDRLAAYADGSGQAALPVVVYLYGGCVVQLPVSQEPIVMVASFEGGSGPADVVNEATGAAPDSPSEQDGADAFTSGDDGAPADALARGTSDATSE